jgi:SPP1 gp7 family putative phage head morphogenesis protein
MSGNVTPLTGKQPAQPKLDTITSLESVFTVGPSEWWRVNPDQLVRQKGLKIFGLMRLDDQVKAASTFKRDAIVSRGWTFSYDDSCPLSPEEQARRMGIYEQIIDAYPGSFVDALNAIAAGRDYGFSLVEKVFSAVEIDEGTAIGISSLRYRDPTTFEFVTDGYGTLTEFRQRAGGQLTTLDLNDFVYYVHAPEEDPYFGRSDLRAAYKYWYAKGRIQDYWLIHLERLAGGFPVLTAKDSSAPRAGTNDYYAMQTTLANLKGSAGLLVPQGMEFKLEMPGDTQAFQEAITFFDLGIARSMLVPNLLGASHTGQTGAYSQSQTQLESFYWTLQQDQARLEACLNEQLFKPLAKYNFADGDGPCFAFKPLSEERLRWLVTTWTAMVSAGTAVATEEDEAFLRNLLDMPARDELSTPIVTPAQKLAQDTMQANAEAKAQQAKQAQDAAAAKLADLESRLERLTAQFAARQDNTVNVTLPPSVGTAATHTHSGDDATRAEGHVHVHAQPRSCSLAAFTAAAQRVNFSVIEQRQMAATASTVADAAKIVAQVVSRIASDSKIQNAVAQPEKIQTIKFSGDEVGKLKNAVKAGLMNSYIDGVSTGRNELDRAGFQPKAKMARLSFTDIRNVAADYIDSNAFRIAGNASDAVKGIIQQELLNGVKAGSTAGEIRTAIWNRLVAKGMTSAEAVQGVETDEGVNAALDALWVDTEAQAAAYLNTAIRTNLFDAFNEGRYAEFTDPALEGFVEALEYSAVLDDRTTELCMQLDGSVWNADSPNWDVFRPPNHFNCRSILIPVTQVDTARGEWDGNESPDPPADLQPADGFGAGEK